MLDFCSLAISFQLLRFMRSTRISFK
jgi:hypothetical protein